MLSIYGSGGTRQNVVVNPDGTLLDLGSEHRTAFWTMNLGELWKMRVSHDDSGAPPLAFALFQL